jgi:hypothetical protein
VKWLLVNAPTDRPIQHGPSDVAHLRVVANCGCGCASIDFELEGQSGGSRPIADATGLTETGLQVGLILWGRDDAVTGLEVYELDPDSAGTLPRLDTLRPHAA